MPAVPQTKATWTNGVDALSSTNLHAYFRDPIRFLMNPPIAELRQTSAQNHNSTGNWIPLIWQSEDLDDDVDGTGGHSTSSNTTRYTARYPGWYQCSGAYAPAGNATGRRGTRWARNGSALDGSSVLLPAANTGLVYPSRTKHVFLDEGDYVELQMFQDSGGNLLTIVTGDAQSHASIRWVSLA